MKRFWAILAVCALVLACMTGCMQSATKEETKEEAKTPQLPEKLKLDEHSVILLFSTEGDTDPAGWRNVVYNGAYPMAE